MLRLIEELSNIYGVSGDEGRVRRYIKAALKDLPGIEMKTDTIGNLIVHKKGEGPRIMLCAHMDEVGCIVKGILDNGLIAYSQEGIDSRVVVSKRVVIGDDDVPGVIGAKAIHLQSRDELERALPHSELFVDIGAKDKDDARKYVNPGDHICFTTKFKYLSDKRVMGKALDDRIGCAVLMELLKNDYECDFYAVFTTQEELGMRGAETAVFNIAPQLVIALECTTANDMPENKETGYVARLGGGVAVTLMDKATVVPQKLFKALFATAKAAGIPCQPKQSTTGATDATVHKALSGAIAGSVCVPCRYMHSPATIADVDDIKGMYTLVDSFLKNKIFNEVI